MDYNHKINIIKMNKVSAVLLLSSNMFFKNVIKSGKHLKSVKNCFCLIWSLLFSTIITAVHLFLQYMCRNILFMRLHTSEIKSCCIFRRKTQFKICYGMDIFPGHVTFDDLLKQSDWLLRLPLVCFNYFRVSWLLSIKKKVTFFQLLFIFSPH